ncbi:MAG: hypothetical protein IOC49_01590 [Methylobacterium sp.]|jgi:hypothetical protein|nr:hypothetical protein [Methylobacterium sp.]
MTTNEDARLGATPAAPIAVAPATEAPGNSESPENDQAERASDDPPENEKTPEAGTPATRLVSDVGPFGTSADPIAMFSPPPEPVVAAAAEIPEDRRPLTPEEFDEALGVADLPETLQRLLYAAPFNVVDLLDRYVELFGLEDWYLKYQPFHDARLVFAKGWLADLLVMEIALRPAGSRDELRSRVMMLADSRADRVENGYFELICETVLRADIARLGLPADDPVVTHFESRMALKKARKTEG